MHKLYGLFVFSSLWEAKGLFLLFFISVPASTKKIARFFYNGFIGIAGREVLHIYVVYLDTLFFTNLFLDFICLFAVGLFECRRKALRLFAVAAAGSALGIACFILIHNYPLYTLLLFCVVNPGMVLFAFSPQTIRMFGIRLAGFYLCYLILGGGADYMQRWLAPELPLIWILCAVSLFLVGISVLMGWHEKHRRQFSRAVLQNGDQTVVCRALCDSGNRLMDPYLKLPVSVVPRMLKEQLQVGPEQIRLVPFSTVEGGTNLMEVATLPVMLLGDRGEERAVRPVVVGFAQNEVFRYKRYDMILHGDYSMDRER